MRLFPIMMCSVNIVSLVNHPECVPVLARWYFAEWGHADPGMTEKRILDRIMTSVVGDELPFFLIAMDNGQLVGAAEFKIREMAIFPEYEFWLGGVFVRQDKRRKQIASKLVAAVLLKVRSLGVTEIYLQTEDLSGGLYCRHGFEAQQEVVNDGHHVLIMKAKL